MAAKRPGRPNGSTTVNKGEINTVEAAAAAAEAAGKPLSKYKLAKLAAILAAPVQAVSRGRGRPPVSR